MTLLKNTLLILRDKDGNEVYQIPAEDEKSANSHYIVRGTKVYEWEEFSPGLHYSYYRESDDTMIYVHKEE